MTTLSPTEQATIDAHWQHQAETTAATLMPIPNVVASLTAQRDEARAALAAKAGQHQQAAAALQALAGQYQQVLADLREANARLLAADQQNANEPCLFTDSGLDDPFPTTTGHVMPATALRHDKQAIGLLW